MVCHVDIEKSYEHVNYNFIDYPLQSLGFGGSGHAWIKMRISTASLSILVSIFPVGFFRSSGGHR